MSDSDIPEMPLFSLVPMTHPGEPIIFQNGRKSDLRSYLAKRGVTASSRLKLSELRDLARAAHAEHEEEYRIFTQELLSSVMETRRPEPDIPVPGYHEGRRLGWTYNIYSQSVTKVWTTSVSHGRGHPAEGEKVGAASYGPGPIYSTRERAARALVHESITELLKKLGARI